MRKEDYPESDPRHHVANIHRLLDDVLRHGREDVVKVCEQKALALFETTAEVLGGLKIAFEHYATAREPGMAAS